MKAPFNRREFEHNIDILTESIEKQRFHAPPSRRMRESLLNARESPNRRINFLTVDETVRLLANSLAHFDRTDFKNKKDAGEQETI